MLDGRSHLSLDIILLCLKLICPLVERKNKEIDRDA